MSSGADEIRLTLPATAGHARVARLALTGLASRSGFTYDEVEDVRIAVGELYSLLVDGSPPGTQVLLRCQMGDGSIEIEGQPIPSRPIGPISAMSRRILAAVTASHEVDEQAGRIRFSAIASERP